MVVSVLHYKKNKSHPSVRIIESTFSESELVNTLDSQNMGTHKYVSMARQTAS